MQAGQTYCGRRQQTVRTVLRAEPMSGPPLVALAGHGEAVDVVVKLTRMLLICTRWSSCGCIAIRLRLISTNYVAHLFAIPAVVTWRGP